MSLWCVYVYVHVTEFHDTSRDSGVLSNGLDSLKKKDIAKNPIDLTLKNFLLNVFEQNIWVV